MNKCRMRFWCIVYGLLVCIMLCSCAGRISASDAEKRFESVFSESGSLPASYVSHHIDKDTEKLVIVVTDDRETAKRRYIDLIGENYSERIEFDKHELSRSELMRISEQAGSYIKAKGYEYTGGSFAETGNIISFYVNDENKAACALANELSDKFGIRVIIEIGGDVELMSGLEQDQG